MTLWGNALKKLALAGLSVTLLSGGALADVVPCTIDPGLGLSARDTTRLKGLEDSRAKGLGSLETEADPTVGEAVAGIYDHGVVALKAVIPGPYRCRTIELGSTIDGLMSVVYDYFTCKIGKSPAGFSLAKVTGSQNFTGSLTSAGDGLAYKGASYYGYEGPRKYGDDPEHDQVGCMYGVADNPRHYFLELPAPQFESVFDIIEFVPAK